jgi:hypothetical protein
LSRIGAAIADVDHEVGGRGTADLNTLQTALYALADDSSRPDRLHELPKNWQSRPTPPRQGSATQWQRTVDGELPIRSTNIIFPNSSIDGSS